MFPVFSQTGTYTTNEYFYLPEYGAYGTDEYDEYNIYMQVADTQIESNKTESRTNKWDATSAPGVTNGTDEDYIVGSTWIDITNDKVYVCLDNTDEAAVWIEINQVGSGTVTTSGTPEVNDIARFTGATVIEGLSYTEFKTALDLATLAGTETLTNKTLTEPVINHNVTSKTTTATLNVAESGLVTVTAASAYTILLPTAVGNGGLIYIIKKTDDNSNLITIDGNADETIDGAATYTDLNYQYSYVIIISDNSNWLIIGESIVRGGTF